MKKNILSSLIHLWVFVVIEVLFVFLVLHEFPEISLIESIGIVHLIYWISIFIAWFLRARFKKYIFKFLATFLPVLFHVLWHIYIGHNTLEHAATHSHGSPIWLIISTLTLWVFILIWEYLIHQKYHCDVHHESVHKDCKEI